MVRIEGIVDDRVRDLLVFHYARDWRQSELIWTWLLQARRSSADHQRSRRGPSQAPAAVGTAIPRPYQTATKGAAISSQWMA
jgi:hypothetical protein